MPRKKSHIKGTPGPQKRLVDSFTLSIVLEDRHRLILKIYNSRLRRPLSDSEMIRQAIELFGADITEEEIAAEREREESAGQ